MEAMTCDRLDVLLTTTIADQSADPELPQKIFEILSALRDPTLPPLPPFTSRASTSLLSLSPDSSRDSTTTDPSTKADLPILSITSIRIFTSGPSLLVDVQIVLPGDLTLSEANRVESTVRAACVKHLGGPGRVREVLVRLRGADS